VVGDADGDWVGVFVGVGGVALLVGVTEGVAVFVGVGVTLVGLTVGVAVALICAMSVTYRSWVFVNPADAMVQFAARQSMILPFVLLPNVIAESFGALSVTRPPRLTALSSIVNRFVVEPTRRITSVPIETPRLVPSSGATWGTSCPRRFTSPPKSAGPGTSRSGVGVAVGVVVAPAVWVGVTPVGVGVSDAVAVGVALSRL
jgi:hypothetical protein